jgi:hypothetical protein
MLDMSTTKMPVFIILIKFVAHWVPRTRHGDASNERTQRCRVEKSSRMLGFALSNGVVETFFA